MRRLALCGLVGAVCVALCTTPVAAQGYFLRGDANHDRTIDVSDAVFVLVSLFLTGEPPPCEDAADVDDSGTIDIGDTQALLQAIFLGGPPPAAPFPVFEGDPTPDELGCLPEVPGSVTEGGSELSGDIVEDVILASNKTYRMTSSVTIKEGATLSIDAGVTVLAESGAHAYLIVERGARIDAVGTRTHPIVFTSDRPVGERQRADWAGILVLGRSTSDIPGGEREVRGLPGVWYGGGDSPDPEDSSGRMSYVRVAFAGATVAAGVPQTAIAFYAVGSGTELDHIYAQYGNDDGIEFYGGTADLKYGLAVGNEDECYDSQCGWTGRGQFLVGLQTGDVGNRGFQVGDSPSYEPPTHPTISNMTLVGFRSTRARTDNGILISDKAGLHFYNSIVQGWDDAAVEFGAEYSSVVIDRCAFHDNPNNLCECERTTCPCATVFGEPFVNVQSTEPLVVDPRLLDLPDLRGIEERLPEAIDPHTIDPWFDPVDYVGAVPPQGKGLDWTHEPWVSWRAH